MNLQAILASFTWPVQQCMACFCSSQNALSTAQPGSVENLPKDITLLIMQRVFAQSKGAYGALLRTCKTIYGTWNNAFISTQEKLPLYKTLIACSNGDDERVSAIFERAFGLKGESLRFPGEKKLKIALTDSASETSLRAIAAHFPNCTSLSIVDKRSRPQPQTIPQHLVKWLFPVHIVESDEETRGTGAVIAAALSMLPKLRTLHCTYQHSRPLRFSKIAASLRERAHLSYASSYDDEYASRTITLTPKKPAPPM